MTRHGLSWEMTTDEVGLEVEAKCLEDAIVGGVDLVLIDSRVFIDLIDLTVDSPQVGPAGWDFLVDSGQPREDLRNRGRHLELRGTRIIVLGDCCWYTAIRTRLVPNSSGDPNDASADSSFMFGSEP
ncbi:hypothetical protein FNV43_RR22747 [Rhamnella rubrinervis]|uniref:Uncharacterized protein n=1 Tax=Rhamnella rubrinervis TaxID=2594499 RepID=A0A8K0GSB9_9ROSA|nr:hypothetical protein FNV43_RR22747 [Rhamnella rubrinervis]